MASDDKYDDRPMTKKGYDQDQDVREDGVEHQFNMLDETLKELADMIERMGSRVRPYLRPERAEPSDPNMTPKMPEECSDIGSRLRNVREQVNRSIRNVIEITGRIDD